MAFKDTILHEAYQLFISRGVKNLTKQDILKSLSISEATFDEYFKNKEDLLKQAVLYDQQETRERDQKIAAQTDNAVVELLSIIAAGIEKLKHTNPEYIKDLVKHYPEVLQLGLNNIENYSYHLIYGILNAGVQEGLFRKDMNMEIVTKIMLSNVNLLLDQRNFPSDRYDLDEIFRCIYLYYIRGLCTDPALKYAEKFFA